MMRRSINLNRQWKFFRGDCLGAHSPAFDDSAWQPIHLPHCFDIPYFRTPEFYVGVGWYRKILDFDPDWKDKRLVLEFDGVFQEAEIFLNGQPVGTHQGGYTGFSVDITRAAKTDSNQLAIRVNNNWNPRIAPRAGEHIFSGGLYRDVRLIVTHPLHATWNGIGVTTPRVSESYAQVRVITEVRNDSSEPRDCCISQLICDSAGQLVAQTHSEFISMAPGKTLTFDQAADVSNPALWHPDHPNLYTVETEIYDGNDLVDQLSTTFGIRFFQWTPDRGFFLNGEHLYIRGANAHQDRAGWGIAATAAAQWRDVRLIKDAGFNFVRGAHYPHHPAFADACDSLGLLFCSENAFWGKGGFGPDGYWNASAYPVHPEDFEPFEQNCKQQLTEMIRINRNHPSIIAWSMTNEAFFTYNLDRAKSLIKDLVDLSRQLDPTRPTAIGGCQRGDLDKLGDVAGYNGDGARLFLNPGVPNIVSEYGALSKPPESYDPFYGELQPDHENYPWRSGQAIWAAFDYGSIAGKQGLKGILTHDRLPKRSWDWYRDHHAPPEGGETPRLQKVGGEGIVLSADKTTITDTDGTDDCQIIVALPASSGDKTVTLRILSGPGEFPTGRSITFDNSTDTRLTLNRAAVEFRSYHAGVTRIRASAPGLNDAEISIATTGEPEFIEGETPVACDRPYIAPPMSPAAMAAMKNAVNVARDRPSRASSYHPDHPPRLANDAETGSFWQASTPQESHWWLVDLEGFYQISSSKLTFPRDAQFRYVIETSLNANEWTMAADRRPTNRTDRIRDDIYPPACVARYVRIMFEPSPDPLPIAIAEFELFGILSLR